MKGAKKYVLKSLYEMVTLVKFCGDNMELGSLV